MRLTLRTLLAWLDDTLQPAQVKEIGSQVAGSPFAQELTERIHRVTRQRRLSVPSSSGPDGIDPNLVASYLDNELDPDAVADYEKKCLSHDVVLAEVASVHQILCLLGHKVKVPAAARARMYQLVKGRDSTRGAEPAKARADQPEPLTKPINPWVVPEAPERSALERFGPAVACLFLIGLCGTLAWLSLMAPPPEGIRTLPLGGVTAKEEPAGPKADEAAGAVAKKDAPTEIVDVMPGVPLPPDASAVLNRRMPVKRRAKRPVKPLRREPTAPRRRQGRPRKWWYPPGQRGWHRLPRGSCCGMIPTRASGNG